MSKMLSTNLRMSKLHTTFNLQFKINKNGNNNFVSNQFQTKQVYKLGRQLPQTKLSELVRRGQQQFKLSFSTNSPSKKLDLNTCQTHRRKHFYSLLPLTEKFSQLPIRQREAGNCDDSEENIRQNFPWHFGEKFIPQLFQGGN